MLLEVTGRCPGDPAAQPTRLTSHPSARAALEHAADRVRAAWARHAAGDRPATEPRPEPRTGKPWPPATGVAGPTAGAGRRHATRCSRRRRARPRFLPVPEPRRARARKGQAMRQMPRERSPRPQRWKRSTATRGRPRRARQHGARRRRRPRPRVRLERPGTRGRRRCPEARRQRVRGRARAACRAPARSGRRATPHGGALRGSQRPRAALGPIARFRAQPWACDPPQTNLLVPVKREQRSQEGDSLMLNTATVTARSSPPERRRSFAPPSPVASQTHTSPPRTSRGGSVSRSGWRSAPSCCPRPPLGTERWIRSARHG